MKTLLILFLGIFTTGSSAGIYKEYFTYVKTIDGIAAPSCDVVHYRVQEFIRREFEVEEVLEWYSPLELTREQRAGLLALFRRMPFFQEDRVYEHLLVYHEWKVNPEELQKHRTFVKKSSVFRNSKYDWSDPHNGTFPEDVEVRVTEDTVYLKQKMSFERFCLGAEKILIILQPGEDEIILHGENSIELLD